MPRRNSGPAALFLALACLIFLPAPVPAQAARADALELYRAGSYEEARQACLAELSQDAGNMESYVVLCWSLLALGRHADAELYARKAYETIRKDPRIVEVLGEATFFLGKNDESLKHFQSYVNLLPDSSKLGQIYQYMGELYLRMERWSHADMAFRTALQYNPGNARWWARMGYARERAGEWTWALEAYEAALKLDPALSDAVLGRDRAIKKIRG